MFKAIQEMYIHLDKKEKRYKKIRKNIKCMMRSCIFIGIWPFLYILDTELLVKHNKLILEKIAILSKANLRSITHSDILDTHKK